MAMWDGFQAASLGSTSIAVPAGTTNALFIQPTPGQNWIWMKWISGGSCEILPCGTTFLPNQIGTNSYYAQTVANLNKLAGTGYQIDTTGGTGPTTFQMYGTPYFMIGTQGATAIVHILFGKAAGY